MRIEWKEIPKEETIYKIAEKYQGVKPKSLEAYLKMLWTVAQIDSVVESHFSQWGLSRGRFMLLMMLHRESCGVIMETKHGVPGALTPSELADQLDVTRGNMTGLIDGLEREGWIRREDLPGDRRGLLIHLTDEGKSRLEKMLPIHFKRMGKMLSNLTSEEAEGLLTGMARLLSGLTAFREEIEKNPVKGE